MKKTYQPQIIELSNKIIDVLITDNFFDDIDIDNIEPAQLVLCDYLTQKFINLDELESIISNEKEFGEVLKLMLASINLNNLKRKGFLNSFIDEDGEEKYFLTETGKLFLELENERS